MKDSRIKRFSSMFAAGTLLAASAIAAASGLSTGQVLIPKKPFLATAGVASAARGEVIVRYKAGVAIDDAKQLVSDKGLAVVRAFEMLSARGDGAYVVVKGALSTDELISKLKADPNVEAVSPNYIRRLSAVPNDPKFDLLWGLCNTGQTIGGTTGSAGADINATAAWDVSTGSSDTVVAVFDTGVDYTHVDLADNMWINSGEIAGNSIDDDGDGIVDDVYGADFASDNSGGNDGDPMDIIGHGTHVAGTIGAVGDNGLGVTGVNWNVKIMALKVFRPDGSAYDSDILEAIDYTLQKKSNGVNVVAVNASYGGYGGNQSDPINDAIKSLGNAGIVFCAAAGNEANDNDENPSFPASYNAANIIAVAATDQNDALAYFSNYGATTVDLAAPGENIYSTLPGDAYTPAATDLFYDDFDSGSLSSWTSDGWTATMEASVSPGYSLTDSPGANYANNMSSTVFSDSVDLSSATGFVYLGFKMKMDVEDGEDNVSVIMYDGTDWRYVATYSGENSEWTSYSVMIPEEYRTANFRVGFQLQSNGSIVYDGAHIDNIGINPVTTTASASYGFMSGTSMATPMVTGAVALLASTYPSESVSERRDRILNSVDSLSALSGRTVTGGRLNLYNAMQITVDNNGTSGGSSGGGLFSVYDQPSLLLTVFGFLFLGGLIARKRLARAQEG